MTRMTLCAFQRPVRIILVNYLLHCLICRNCRTIRFVCSKPIMRVQHLHYYMDGDHGEDNDGRVAALKGTSIQY